MDDMDRKAMVRNLRALSGMGGHSQSWGATIRNEEAWSEVKRHGQKWWGKVEDGKIMSERERCLIRNYVAMRGRLAAVKSGEAQRDMWRHG